MKLNYYSKHVPDFSSREHYVWTHLEKHGSLGEAAQAVYKKIVEVNQPNIEKRMRAYRKRCNDRPLVGEFLIRKDGSITRFTYAWDDSIQSGGGVNGSFFFCTSGGMSYSGGLDSGVKYDEIELTNETMKGQVWHFDREYVKAHNGVNYKVPLRVWRQK